MANPNFALYLDRDALVPALEGVVDGYPEEKHIVRVSKTTAPLEDGATLTDHAVREPNRIELTGFVSDLIGDRGKERAAQAWEVVRSIMDARTLGVIITPWGVYSSMMLIRAEAPRTSSTGGAVRFRLEFEEILIVGVPNLALAPDTTRGEAAARTSEVDLGDLAVKPGGLVIPPPPTPIYGAQ